MILATRKYGTSMERLISAHLDWFYPWLRKFASRLLASERSVTLQPTVLANEVIITLMSWDGTLSEDSNSALKGLARKVAKQLLIDRGRKLAAKRRFLDVKAYRLSQDCIREQSCARGSRVLEIIDAVEQLRSVDPILGELVVLRYFEGLDMDATANRLGISRRTAIRRWGFAKAFLKERLIFGS